MNKIIINDLIELMEEQKTTKTVCSNIFSYYLSWSKLDPILEKELNMLGNLCIGENKPKEIVNENIDNYWSTSFPIDINLYPYPGCTVFKHSKTGCYFLIYTEYGGHGAEKRCRLVQRELIIL